MIKKEQRLSIVILNWNGKENTKECLSSVNRSIVNGFHPQVVLVDNGSSDESYEYFSSNKLLSKNYEFKIIKNALNLGYAEGNNIGISYSLQTKADYVMILNNDTLLDPNTLIHLIKVANDNPKAGIISPKMYFAPGFEFHKERYGKSDIGKIIWWAGGEIDWNNLYGKNMGVDEVDHRQYDSLKYVDFATGACMLVKKEVFEKIGLFNNKYYMYLEDVDFSMRVKKSGWEILYTPKAFLWHKVAQSSGIGSTHNDYFISRNRMLFGLKYAPFRTKTALMRESIRLLFFGRKWEKIGIKDYYLGKFGKGSWN
jgi:hypothetical protein